jgi:hypothetical protein
MAATNAQAGGTAPKARKTRLDNHVDMPSSCEPGDGPFDTTDPREQATSVTPDKAAAARAGFGVVNAVIRLPEDNVVAAGRRASVDEKDQRVETYEVTGPDGKPVRVRHNIETGETTRA